MSAQSTATRPGLVEAAKAPFLAYAAKDWEAARAAMTSDVVYDEVASGRKAEGPEQVLEMYRGWAAALPDSRPTFHASHVSGDMVVLELTWTGTHTGTLQTPKGPLPATGRKISLRACNVMQVVDGKVKLQRQYFDLATLMEQIR